MKTVTLKIRELRAMSNFASTDETRYILNGVCVDARKGRHPLLVATDGRCIGILKTEAEVSTETFELVLPMKLLKDVFKLSAADDFCAFDVSGKDVTAVLGPKTIIFHDALTKGTYPKYHQVIPKFSETDKADRGRVIAGKLLEKFSKAAHALRDTAKYTHGTGLRLVGTSDNSPVLVKMVSCPEFFGVVMPMRSDTADDSVPDWLADDPAEVKPTEPKPKIKNG